MLLFELVLIISLSSLTTMYVINISHFSFCLMLFCALCISTLCAYISTCSLYFTHWSLCSEKTLLMSKPKCPGAQIFRFTWVKLTINPPFETARALSQLFAVQCHQWEPIQNSQLIRIYKEGNIPLPQFKTARALSQLFTVQCHQWEPIRNGQLIRIYKEGNIPLPPFETARALSQLFTVQCHQWEPIWNIQLIRIYKEGNIPLPPFKTAIAQSELCTFQCDQWEPIRNSQLIRIYKEIPVHL